MLISLILLYLFIHTYRLTQTKDTDPVISFINAGVIWILYLYGITEIFSVFHLLTKNSLLLAWSVLSAILLCSLLLSKKRSLSGSYIKNSFKKLKNIKLLHIAVIIYGLFMLFLSYKTVPYNWDSMTYHMSRICHWTQNKSVSHYSTNIIRQVASPVLHEFVDVQVYILSDRKEMLLNLLQCFSYLTSAGMVYCIAQKLQCRKGFCRIAALLYLSLPIAFAESFTTQNDNFATVWMLYFAYILLDFTNLDQKIILTKDTISKVCTLGILVSLGYLTKPSVCIGMAVMVLWLLAVCIRRRDSFKTLIELIGAVIPSIVLPLLPELIRNIKTFSALSDPMTGQRQLIGTLNPLYMFINFLKNILFNLPNVYIYSSDYLLTRFIEKAAGVLHVDLNAASISEDGGSFLMHTAPDYRHDTALNPIIIMLFIFFILYGILHLRQKNLKNALLSYSFASTACFLIFCCVLRWEPFVSRYMSAYLALLCPMIALQLDKLNNLKLQSAITGIICFLCIADLFSMGRYHRNLYAWHGAGVTPSGYFMNRVGEQEPYMTAVETIQKYGFQKIGLKIEEDNYEYPLWKMLENDVSEIEHVYVENATAKYENTDFTPDCIIWFGPLAKEPVQRNGKEYKNKIEIQANYYLLY